MASGIGLSDHVLLEYMKLKLSGSLSFIIYKLNRELTEIVVEKSGTGTDWEDFETELPEDECRWAIHNFAFERENGEKAKKIIFISWSPDGAKIKQKMLFASSRDTLRRAIDGVGAEIHATDWDEVSYEAVLSKVNRKTR